MGRGPIPAGGGVEPERVAPSVSSSLTGRYALPTTRDLVHARDREGAGYCGGVDAVSSGSVSNIARPHHAFEDGIQLLPLLGPQQLGEELCPAAPA